MSTLDYKQSGTPLIDRVSFQYYPRGWGYLGKHVDPININQSIVPTIVMSEFGKDYKGGGFFLEYKEKVYYPEKKLSPGDILIFNPIYPHGVETIDQEYKTKSIIAEYTNRSGLLNGRWMGLITTTLPSNSPNAQGVATK